MIACIQCVMSKRPLFILLFVGLLAPTLYAHNVVSGAYAEGMMIEGEVGFSNGDMAEAGSPVQVLNAVGEVLATLRLSEGGAFSYEAKTVAKHIFKVNLSAGHIAEMVIEADELVAPVTTITVTSATKRVTSLLKQTDLGESESQANNSGSAETSSWVNTLTIDQLQSIIRGAVAQQVKPLQKELRAYKEKVMFRDIAGGLGFIFGLFGVAAWMASRRKEGMKDATIS